MVKLAMPKLVSSPTKSNFRAGFSAMLAHEREPVMVALTDCSVPVVELKRGNGVLLIIARPREIALYVLQAGRLVERLCSTASCRG